MHQLSDFFALCTSLHFASVALKGWRAAVPCNTRKIPGAKKFLFKNFDCTVDAIRTICGVLYFPDMKQMSLLLDFTGQPRIYYPTHLDHGALMLDILLQH